MNHLSRRRLGWKCAVFSAVIIVAFLCGWSATGLTGGFVLAVALGAGTAVPIFSDTAGRESLHSSRRTSETRSEK